MNLVSASVDHHKLNVGLHKWEEVQTVPGLYLYDLRFKKPIINKEQQDVLSADSMHTIEHFLAFYLRKISAPEKTLSFFPYGCQTGFGCLSFLPPNEFKQALIKTIEFVLEQDEVPFSSTKLCGNMFLNNKDQAHKDLKSYLEIVKNQSEEEMFNTPFVE